MSNEKNDVDKNLLPYKEKLLEYVEKEYENQSMQYENLMNRVNISLTLIAGAVFILPSIIPLANGKIENVIEATLNSSDPLKTVMVVVALIALVFSIAIFFFLLLLRKKICVIKVDSLYDLFYVSNEYLPPEADSQKFYTGLLNAINNENKRYLAKKQKAYNVAVILLWIFIVIEIAVAYL